ncbi:ATP dependent DNA helicase dda [Bacteriophage sp.]|nr:ATP dependent DNA helicase dda [Bacteriophage sp.]
MNIQSPAQAPVSRPPLNEEQQAALEQMLKWLDSPFATSGPFFLLRGSAGTGKTFCIRELVDRRKGRVIFTAPTNKATKVLRRSVTTKDYKPECRTIYSLLGLRLQPTGEVKELKVPEDPIDLSKYLAIVVDEGSMVNQILWKFIQKTAHDYKIKFIFMGDPAQLNPVKEGLSPIWGIEQSASLETVMRHDNQILTLATHLRTQIEHPAPRPKLVDDNADDVGVWKVSPVVFNQWIDQYAQDGLFSKPDGAKIIAWRNVTVDKYNAQVRRTIFGPEAHQPWLPGDRVIFTSPATTIDDQPMASTDDEGTVERVAVDWSRRDGDFKVYYITIALDDGSMVVAEVLHPDYKSAFDRRVAELKAEALAIPRKWKFFWEFQECFHNLRHAYAITAHRAQGSTYNTAFVDYRDVLLNQNTAESMRCLYVACTRPKYRLFLG